MIQDEILKTRLMQMLQQEHNWLINVRGQGVFSLPKPVLRYLAARVFLHHQLEICPDCQLHWNASKVNDDAHEVFLHFTLSFNDEKQEVLLDLQTAHFEDNLFGRLGSILQMQLNGKKLIFTLLAAEGAQQVEAWQQKWYHSFSDHLKIISLAEPVNAEQTLWLIMWQMLPLDNEINPGINTGKAMLAAVQNMQYENMFSIIKKIIALRTNLDESNMAEDMHISHMFKMVFAREQGVNPDEVYDPEAFAGLTDSQIAAGNLVSDLQKTFNVSFAENEMQKIVTLKDLVGSIMAKKW